ncbi:MAG: HAMP domain-containing sensor histidine kinase [Rhodohalobacter sp.]|nr:HAMP domain-containing sensor histidine kinase [Rhodohalobacter sp.]
MGKQGSLDIRCGTGEKENDNGKTKEVIWVSIKDSGPGIPEENLEKIFEPKFSTKKTGAKFGLGLGLSISEDIVEHHGGEIKAENAEDGGARFIVTLPVKTEQKSL